MICNICGKYIKSPTKDTRDLGFCGKCRIKKWQNYIEILKEEKKSNKKREEKIVR
jgi:hypothetical protein|tara:strand:- start:1000 stop:1164 length:165 start_codon:yes stop_codon:yes gene_type:complete